MDEEADNARDHQEQGERSAEDIAAYRTAVRKANAELEQQWSQPAVEPHKRKATRRDDLKGGV